MADSEKCVCCGCEIPEGRQVCPSCENRMAQRKAMGYSSKGWAWQALYILRWWLRGKPSVFKRKGGGQNG